MLPKDFRGCKVNINFPNFTTIAANLFQNFLIIAFRDSRNLCELLRTEESAEPVAVADNRDDCLLADARHAPQRGRIGRVDLDGNVDRFRFAFGEDDVRFERR